jgi:L,D-transpeptidase catalytic domain
MTRRACWWVLAAVLSSACSEALPTTTPSPTSAADPPPAPPSPTFPNGCATSPTALPASPLYDPADPRLRASAVLVAHKSGRRLMLFAHGKLQRCWAMGLGFDPRGHKQHEGDGRTPEGWYRTSDKPWSDFAGAIAVHYPNDDDAAVALADGRLAAPEHEDVLDALAHETVPPQQTALGGEILIHGGGSRQDWTLGCMALEDEDLAGLRATLPSDQQAWLLVLP